LKSHSKLCNDHTRVLSSAGALSLFLNRRQQNTAHPERVREIRRLHDHRRHWLAAHFRGSNFVFLSESANHAVECGTGDRSVVEVEDKKKKETSICNAVESDGTLWLVDKAHCRLFNAGNLKLWRALMSLPEPIARSLQDRWDPHQGNIPTDSVCFSKLVEWFDGTKWGTRARTSQYESHAHVLVEAAHFVLNPRMYLQWYGQTVMHVLCLFQRNLAGSRRFKATAEMLAYALHFTEHTRTTSTPLWKTTFPWIESGLQQVTWAGSVEEFISAAVLTLLWVTT
jgi:hypothetical protein